MPPDELGLCIIALLKILFMLVNIQYRKIGHTIFVCTHAVNFKTGVKEWKFNLVIDLKNLLVGFCQSEEFIFDNWSQVRIKETLDTVLKSKYPKYMELLKKHLPKNKISLADKLGKVVLCCGEDMFAIKELIAFLWILELPVEQITSILDSIIIKDKVLGELFPYKSTESATYHDAVAKYLETLINVLETEAGPTPNPLNLKKFGRNACLYGALSFNKDTQEMLRSMDLLIPNLPNDLDDLLFILKLQFVKNDPILTIIWLFLKKHGFQGKEVSNDDDFWGGVCPEVKKPDHVKISVIGYLTLLMCEVKDLTITNDWIEEPFSDEVVKIMEGVFESNTFFDHIKTLKHTKNGKNKLGDLCGRVMTHLQDEVMNDEKSKTQFMDRLREVVLIQHQEKAQLTEGDDRAMVVAPEAVDMAVVEIMKYVT